MTGKRRTIGPFSNAALLLYGTVTALLTAMPVLAADSNQHPHHLGLSLTGASHNNEYAAGLGLEYTYRFDNKLGLLLFAEQVNGDFDVQTVGVGLTRFFDSGFKIGGGFGVERKIEKDKYLNLVHVGIGYDWHFDRISVGPIAAIDFIEDNNDTWYLGLGIGYGF